MKTPTGYEGIGAYPFYVMEGTAQFIEGGFTNTPIPNSLILRKTAGIGNKPLAGAQFVIGRLDRPDWQQPPVTYYIKNLGDGPNPAIPSAPDYAMSVTYTTDISLAKVFITGDDGLIAVSHLPARDATGQEINYFYEEIQAPPGYLPTFFYIWQSNFQIYDGQVTYREVRNLEIAPVPMNLTFRKALVDQDGNSIDLTGKRFTFELVRDGEVFAEAQNDDAGIVRFENVWLDVKDPSQQMDFTLRERIPETSACVVYDDTQYDFSVGFQMPGSSSGGSSRTNAPHLLAFGQGPGLSVSGQPLSFAAMRGSFAPPPGGVQPPTKLQGGTPPWVARPSP